MTRANVKETRIWNALNILAILVTAFVALYAGFYVPSAFTEKQLQSTLPVTAAVAGALSALRDRVKIQLSLTIGDEPVTNNLAVSTISIINTGSVAIIPSDYYTNLSINVDKQWKILAVINATGAERPVWKKVTDQQFEASPELLNPRDAITVVLYVTNTEHERLVQEQVTQLKPTWSAHILNLRSISEARNPIQEMNADPFINFPFFVLLYGSALIIMLCGTIFLMIIYINLLYDLSVLKGGRWQSVGAIIGVGMLSLTSSESMTTYLFPNIWVRLTGISNWLNMPWIVLNLVLLVWLSWKAWNARAIPPLPHT
jgi:hypothetical protein